MYFYPLVNHKQNLYNTNKRRQFQKLVLLLTSFKPTGFANYHWSHINTPVKYLEIN